MITRLCQMVAVANGIKSRTHTKISALHHELKKTDLFSGLTRTYHPKDEDGDVWPNETKVVQANVEEELNNAAKAWVELFDAVATQDVGNCLAKADVIVDEEIVLSQIPATTLIFLEKQLVDIRTFITAAPTLDTAKRWEYSENTACFAAEPYERNKTKKELKILVAYEATKEHPAQLREEHVDTVVGTWKTYEYSGAISVTRKNELLVRVDKLIDAVKKAREEANSTVIEQIKIGDAMFEWLLK